MERPSNEKPEAFEEFIDDRRPPSAFPDEDEAPGTPAEDAGENEEAPE
jgi:hypothetical protein